MTVIRSADIEFGPGSVPNTRRRVLIDADRGSGAITLGQLIMNPGSELMMHTHRIEEAMVITRGVATAVLGDETHTLRPGDAILAPAGVKHMLANRSSEPMEFLFFYPAISIQMLRV